MTGYVLITQFSEKSCSSGTNTIVIRILGTLHGENWVRVAGMLYYR